MSQAHNIVLVGFSSFEKVTFESFFRLAARRPPGYVLVDDATQAHLAVINADDATVLRQAMASKPAPQVLLVGSHDGGSGWTLQRRPLNLMKVLAAVESLLAPSIATVPAALTPMNRPTSAIGSATASNVAARPVAPTAPVAASRTPAPAPVTAPTPALQSRPLPAEASAPDASRAGPDSKMRRSVRTGAGELPSFQASRTGVLNGASFTQPPDISQGADVDHILVVDDSDIALKFMRNRLSRFGFSTDLVSSGEEALGRMNTRPYKFVFLDVMMEGLDGYQTCRAIKQRKYSDGKPPVVVMLTSRGGTIDKIRGTLAGCDAYLTKPLNERDLISVLAKHDRQVARGFQETNFGGNSSGFARSIK